MDRTAAEHGGSPGRDAARAHWDTHYASTAGPHAVVDDAVAAAALAHFGDVAGRRLLDLGCGNGEYSLRFAEHGAMVTAVDVSEPAIRNLRSWCSAQDIDTVEATVASAFDIASLGPFDAVFGNFILHHLEPFADFAAELRAAVAPGGRCFFHENSAQSRTLVWARGHLAGRFGIPKYGDADEFPLTPHEIAVLSRHFTVERVIPELYLFRMASGYLFRHRFVGATTALDRAFDRSERVRNHSYYQYVLLS